MQRQSALVVTNPPSERCKTFSESALPPTMPLDSIDLSGRATGCLPDRPRRLRINLGLLP